MLEQGYYNIKNIISMAISRKINSEEELVRSLINKGGSVPNSNNTDNQKKLLQLRIENQLIAKIDNMLNSGMYPKMSRHAWIIFAIESYLEQELKRMELK
jgi:hypothetical protein